jgi:CRISPR/Cas system CSM-associated protein Csm3 (group 7 of RAMP superfamily)
MQRLTYQITLTTREPLRIGAQKDIMSAIDNPISNIGGRPVVQGPTLKGALRGAIERYLIENYKGNDSLKPCIPSDKRTLSSDENKLIAAGLYRKDGACKYRSEEKENKKPICPACYFLGAMGLVGFIRIPTLFISSDHQIQSLYSVRLDRASGTVAEKTNRDYQIIPDGAKFEGNLEVILDDPVRKWTFGKQRQGEVDAWLKEKDAKGVVFSDKTAHAIIQEFIIDRLQGIDLLGGFKSKGCGKVEIKCEPLGERAASS